MEPVRALSQLATHRSVASAGSTTNRATAPQPADGRTERKTMTITGSPGVRTARRQRGGRAGAAVLTAGLLAAAALVVPATTAQAEPVLLSQGRPATASSEENPDYTPARAAVDGDLATRWASEFSDPQWIRVDLGRSADLDRVELVWESAYSTA